MIGHGTLIAYAGQTVTLRGTGTIIANNCAAYLSGSGSVYARASEPARAVMSGTGSVYARATELDRVNVSIHPFICRAASDDYAICKVDLKPFYCQSNDFYVPPEPDRVIASLKPLTAWGYSTVNDATCSVSLKALKCRSGDYDYAICKVWLKPFSAFALEIDQYLLAMYSTLSLDSVGGLAVVDRLEVLGSLTLTGLGEFTEVQSLEVLGSLTLTGSGTLMEVQVLEIYGALSLQSISLLRVGTGPVLDATSRTWVVNLDTGATGQYDDYGFCDFITDPETGISYGLARDGIYELTGTTDAGESISALIDFGKSDYGSPQKKNIPCFYLGCSSTGIMSIQVTVDDQTYTYPARSFSAYIKNHRVDVGKGLIGNYWNPVLINNGFDFDLETTTFDPIQLSRIS